MVFFFGYFCKKKIGFLKNFGGFVVDFMRYFWIYSFLDLFEF